ncbi:hypothetical protein NBRC116601_26720 [Cognatishimia sp. WU-CL00825]
MMGQSALAGTCGYKDCWGGVGFGADGKVGAAYGQWSEQEAFKAVQRACDWGCVQVRTFKNTCAAMAKGQDGKWSWAYSKSRSKAEATAIKICDAKTYDCNVVVWACSP